MHRILAIFNDNEDLQKIIMLLSLGAFKVRIALSGEEAEEILEKGFAPQLLIIGGKVRGMAADDIAHLLQGVIKADTQILALAAAGDELDPALFDAILRMPCKMSELEAAMQALGFGIF